MGKRVGIAMVLVAFLAPASASATTAEVSTASVSADGSQITIAGSVTWTGCEIKFPEPPPPPPGPEEEEEGEGEEELPPLDSPPPHCGWTPFATVGPGSDPAECSLPERQWPEALGPGVALTWKGAESRGAGTVSFEVADLPVSGGGGQLVCLGLIERAYSSSYYEVKSRPLASALASMNEPAPAGSPSTVDQAGSTQPSRRRHHHHRAKRRHHGISISQHIAVSKN